MSDTNMEASTYSPADLLSGVVPLKVVIEHTHDGKGVLDTRIETPDGMAAAICVHPPELGEAFASVAHLLNVARAADEFRNKLGRPPTRAEDVMTDDQVEALDTLRVALYVVRDLLAKVPK